MVSDSLSLSPVEGVFRQRLAGSAASRAGRMTTVADNICGLRLTFTISAAILAAGFRLTLPTRMSALLWFVHGFLHV